MATASVSRTVQVNAPKSVVWEILADFPNIAAWTSSVKHSESTGDAVGGVGATRHCDLAPAGAIEERIVEWEPEAKLVIDVYDTKLIPIKSSMTTFSLDAVDENTTNVTMSPKAVAKGGVFAGFIAKRLEKGLPKGADALLEDLKAEAERRMASV